MVLTLLLTFTEASRCIMLLKYIGIVMVVRHLEACLQQKNIELCI